jgi:CheY-like chemotaxis protein
MEMTFKKLRNTLFFAIVIPLIIFIIPFEYYDWWDSALLMYGLCSFFLTINLFIWGFWWFKSRLRPSTIFTVILLLFGCLEYILVANFVARWKFVYGTINEYQVFISSDFWSYRTAPELVLFIWLFCWIISRIVGSSKGAGMEHNRLRVLLVEDDKDVSDMMHHVIDSMKTFSIDRAYTYDEALAMFEPGKYVCCTIDLNLGKSIKEGVDLACKFRQDDQDVFIAVVSGYFDEIFDQRLLDTVDDFLQKPFDITVFKLKVFLWAIKYRRRLEVKKYIEGSDFQLKSEILNDLEGKIKKMLNGTK